MESGNGDGFPWNISSSGEKSSHDHGVVKIPILFREMPVGDKRHFIFTNPRPRLHLCCQNWGVLLRGQEKTKLECFWSVLMNSNMKLSCCVFASVFIEFRCFRNAHMTELSGPQPWYICWKFLTYSSRVQILGMFSGWNPGAGIVFHGRSFSGKDLD